MHETADSGRPALEAVLAEHIAALRIIPDESRVVVGDQSVRAPDPVALRAQLSTALYEHWHAGSAGRDPGPAVYRRDRPFERDLDAATPHRTTATPAALRALPDAADPEHAVAEVNRVRVLVPADLAAGREVGDALMLDLPAVRPMLSPGFLLATGTAGAGGGPGVLRVYVHVETPEHAPAVWRAALGTLEGRGARYRAKVLSRRSSYPRRDAIVVYLPKDSHACVPDLVRALDGLPGVGAATSVLARRIAPGLAMAWEPADQRLGWQRVSFGQHRAMAVAHAVVRTMVDGVPLAGAVVEELTAAGVDVSDPARNLESPAFPDAAATAATAAADADAADLAAVPA